ncbi:Phage minor capsid protein 2 [Seinonella peptonophila]|uniref:Phage minor capsid protein 2 n=1 Tax=Seinonella peptonophila TaxID=112248 RepID=A0A1M4VBQ3_9BACL|nr:phage minor capsid protein [Seinonella peptonophila]SHE66415.1 Phage minor capsid protein 2 [Seinonella peptonophila]
MTYQPPEERETYNELIEKLEQILQGSSDQLKAFLLSIDFQNLSPKDQREIEKRIDEILITTNQQLFTWVDMAINYAYIVGVAITLMTLGLQPAMKAAKDTVKMGNQLNKQTVNQIKKVTYNDLLLMTQNTSQRVKDVVTRVVMENIRNREIGVSLKENYRNIIRGLKEEASQAADFSIIDRANRTWTIESYSKMVARTKVMQAQFEGTINESLKREAYYGVISSHNSKHASCRKWEGKIVKLTADVPGDYPLLSDLRAYEFKEIFHPSCKHHVFPVRNLEALPPQIKERNEK